MSSWTRASRTGGDRDAGVWAMGTPRWLLVWNRESGGSSISNLHTLNRVAVSCAKTPSTSSCGMAREGSADGRASAWVSRLWMSTSMPRAFSECWAASMISNPTSSVSSRMLCASLYGEKMCGGTRIGSAPAPPAAVCRSVVVLVAITPSASDRASPTSRSSFRSASSVSPRPAKARDLGA